MSAASVSTPGDGLDVIVIGAGIVGAACARELAERGLRVCVLDPVRRGATAAGMGHLVSVDGSPPELALCKYSLDLWQDCAAALPAACGYRACGTLWIAETEADCAAAQAKQQTLAAEGIVSEWLNPVALARAEPMLRSGLAGALRVPGDGIVYAPRVARWLLEQPACGLRFCPERAVAFESGRVQLASGAWLAAEHVVLANGLEAGALLPDIRLIPKKGHLLITDRGPAAIHHQLVELAYARQAHAAVDLSVAFNVQPRPTGQVLIGSSRQLNTTDPAVEAHVLGPMLRRACDFLPALARVTAIRSWTGFRATTADDMPVIGPWPDRPGLWVALGHEGHGVTTSLGTARLLADSLLGHEPAIDPRPYAADRPTLRAA